MLADGVHVVLVLQGGGALGDFGTQTVPQLNDTIRQLDQATRSLQSLIDNVRESPRDFIAKAPSKEIEVQP